jgi:hypothetical protein
LITRFTKGFYYA